MSLTRAYNYIVFTANAICPEGLVSPFSSQQENAIYPVEKRCGKQFVIG